MNHPKRNLRSQQKCKSVLNPFLHLSKMADLDKTVSNFLKANSQFNCQTILQSKFVKKNHSSAELSAMKDFGTLQINQSLQVIEKAKRICSSVMIPKIEQNNDKKLIYYPIVKQEIFMDSQSLNHEIALIDKTMPYI